MKVIIRNVAPEDQDWLTAIFADGTFKETSPIEVNMLNLSGLPGFVAQIGENRVGVVSYQVGKKGYEIIMLHSERPGLGIGRALVNAVIMEASNAKHKKVTTLTRNGNEKAVAFYKGLGFTIGTVRPGAGERAKGGTSRISKCDEVELVFKI